MGIDLFSKQSDLYAQYRPGYPAELIEYIVSFVKEKTLAWDAATGNGQAAVMLADHFTKVLATDISLAQINNAIAKTNIDYSLSPAESTLFGDNSFDLITVAQAYHWLDQQAFQKEATRVAKNGCVIAVWMYGMFTTGNEKIDQLMHHLEYDIAGPYWHENRKYVNAKYENIDFNFEQLPVKDFFMKASWNREHIKGYISSWSSVHKFMEVHDRSPLIAFENELDALMTAEENINLEFPVYLKLGRIVK